MSLRATLLAYARARSVPVYATIELLARCNLHCIHCYVTHSKHERLDLPVIEHTLDQLAELGCMFVTLTGGEVGLRRDLFDIVAAARDRHFGVGLLSSGTCFGPREWRAIQSLGVQMVRLSLYSADERIHDGVTGVTGSHTRTMTTLTGLLDVGVTVEINCPVMRANHESLPQLAALAEALHVKIGFVPRITRTDFGEPHTKVHEVDADALEQLFTWQVERHPGRDVRPEVELKDGYLCGCGRSGLFLSCTGDVFPCIDWPTPAGNIFASSVAQIWKESPEMRRSRRAAATTLPVCESCEARGWCSPCVANNLVEGGSVTVPAPNVCRAGHAARRAHQAKRHRG